MIHAQPSHAWLSQHYGWGLQQAFAKRGHSHLIVLEDDMEFSPDFLFFFQVIASISWPKTRWVACTVPTHERILTLVRTANDSVSLWTLS